MNIAIIGCGNMGQRRAQAIGPEHKIVACYDSKLSVAHSFGKKYGIDAWAPHGIFSQPDVDIVIIGTTHDHLADYTRDAICRNKHVLVEKPAGIAVKEINRCMDFLKDSRSKVRVGFNHRYHRAIRVAHDLFINGKIGSLLYIRGRYGHGGRPGYENEWRADKLLSGGGELIDQGVHLIDLARWFMGDLKLAYGLAQTCFWPMEVEDNGFMVLRNADGRVAFLHASCTEWKNTFSFEIFGSKGKLEISGLGGSYGVERLTIYKMTPEMGPPETTSFEYPMVDDSLEIEFKELIDDIKYGRASVPGLSEAASALEIVEEIYKK